MKKTKAEAFTAAVIRGAKARGLVVVGLVRDDTTREAHAIVSGATAIEAVASFEIAKMTLMVSSGLMNVGAGKDIE